MENSHQIEEDLVFQKADVSYQLPPIQQIKRMLVNLFNDTFFNQLLKQEITHNQQQYLLNDTKLLQQCRGEIAYLEFQNSSEQNQTIDELMHHLKNIEKESFEIINQINKDSAYNKQQINQINEDKIKLTQQTLIMSNKVQELEKSLGFYI